MQKINILGIMLTDYSLKESLLLVDEFVRNGALNTILYVTTPMLILAGKDEREKELIETMDMTLCGDTDILRVARVESKSRLYEVENMIFLKEFLRRIVRNNQTVYILSDSEEEAVNLKKDIKTFQKGITIAGTGIVKEETEGIVNSINDVAPTVIISRMSLGRQEKWLAEAKSFINAEVWLGISKDMKLGENRESFRKRTMDRIYRKMFHRRISRYIGESEKK